MLLEHNYGEKSQTQRWLEMLSAVALLILFVLSIYFSFQKIGCDSTLFFNIITNLVLASAFFIFLMWWKAETNMEDKWFYILILLGVTLAVSSLGTIITAKNACPAPRWCPTDGCTESDVYDMVTGSCKTRCEGPVQLFEIKDNTMREIFKCNAKDCKVDCPKSNLLKELIRSI
eukprot:TRINITY_DN14227_c0_g1_i1.p1 TRINITY_DN14227_c0_g1~~TRINITY_DN14227_c0_g1_i1.p1  ORF type:complete len:184 (+),score=45.69 TRINITY_DN14227_c0_g1_i1:32-553(+)